METALHVRVDAMHSTGAVENNEHGAIYLRRTGIRVCCGCSARDTCGGCGGVGVHPPPAWISDLLAVSVQMNQHGRVLNFRRGYGVTFRFENTFIVSCSSYYYSLLT